MVKPVGRKPRREWIPPSILNEVRRMRNRKAKLLCKEYNSAESRWVKTKLAERRAFEHLQFVRATIAGYYKQASR